MFFICFRFHVDKMSSAHVYLRLHKGQTIDDISEGLLEDCAQLVKANSIQGKISEKIFTLYCDSINHPFILIVYQVVCTPPMWFFLLFNLL